MTSPPADPPPLTMVCHPSCRPGAVAGIGAWLSRSADTLELRFRLDGRLDHLVVPPATAAGRHDGLWRHTCFEAFVRRAGGADYAELNVSPSGQWAAYRFDGYREGRRDLELAGAPSIGVRRGEGRLEVVCRLIRMPEPWRRAARLRLALSAVVEAAGGDLSYWALAHPAGPPDFHHPAAAVLEVCLENRGNVSSSA